MKGMCVHTENYVYPGNYVPMVTMENVQEELKHPCEGRSLLPPVNITEIKGAYLVEMAVPGVKREDFLLQADDNILSVAVLHKESGATAAKHTLHEYNYHCFHRHILLPANAETEMAVAEYTSGVLLVYVPKTSGPVKGTHTTIVVY